MLSMRGCRSRFPATRSRLRLPAKTDTDNHRLLAVAAVCDTVDETMAVRYFAATTAPPLIKCEDIALQVGGNCFRLLTAAGVRLRTG